MLEGVGFTVSSALLNGIIFVLDISNAFQNTILSNPVEIVHRSLLHLYMYWYKRNFPNHTLA